MSLNLQPGQILPNSIYQPTQPSHFPPEFSRGAHPPSHGSRAPRGPVEPGHGHETATAGPPLRRNQTLPAAGLAQSPPGQSFQVSPHVTSEVLPYQRPYPTDSNVHQPNPPPPRPVDSVPSRSSGRRRTSQMSRHPSELPYASPPSYSHPSQSTGVDYDNTRYSPYADTSHNTGPPSQIAPVVSIAPPSAPATPVEHRFSHTLYLTNPDETTGASGHHTHGPPLPTAPEMVHPSGERQSERPRRSHHASLYGGQPSPAGTRLTDSENRRRSTPRGSPPNTTTTPEQDSPRRFEPPSQTIAAINAQYVGKLHPRLRHLALRQALRRGMSQSAWSCQRHLPTLPRLLRRHPRRSILACKYYWAARTSTAQARPTRQYASAATYSVIPPTDGEEWHIFYV
ncbi:hypothetical protein BJV77DRAFT_186306 [Russula vinacea]|nr:hypothetical protein BJV77DRAFT_186306 [Russula vinacea]